MWKQNCFGYTVFLEHCLVEEGLKSKCCRLPVRWVRLNQFGESSIFSTSLTSATQLFGPSFHHTCVTCVTQPTAPCRFLKVGCGFNAHKWLNVQSLKESSGIQRRPNPKPPYQVSQVQCKTCCETCATCATCQSATSGFVTCQAKSSQQTAHLQSTETWVTWHRSSVPVFLRYVQLFFWVFKIWTFIGVSFILMVLISKIIMYHIIVLPWRWYVLCKFSHKCWWHMTGTQNSEAFK